MTQPTPITIRRSKDPSMLELWSDHKLYAVVHEDMFYISSKDNIREIMDSRRCSEVNFEMVLKED